MSSSSSVVPLRQPDTVDDPLTAVLRDGARRLLAQAVEAEAEAFLAAMRQMRLPDGRERLIRHGHGPERLVQTGIGLVAVQRVKLRDRGAGDRVPVLDALAMPAPGASASRRRSCRAGRGGPGAWFRQASLGGMASGGVRESAQSWRELLVDLKARGLAIAPELANGDGALGSWKALDEVSPTTRHRRCTLHKTVNVLDKLPKSVRPAAKADLREVWTAPGRAGRRRRRPLRRSPTSIGAKYGKPACIGAGAATRRFVPAARRRSGV